MKSLTEIKRALRTFRIQPTAQAKQKTLAHALKAQAEAKKTESPASRPIATAKLTKLAVAATILIAASLALYHLTVLLEMTTPAFADVMEKMLSQKWVYMFEEDRRSGRITHEYWYNPTDRKLYCKGHGSEDYAFLLDIAAQESLEYRDDEITITRPDNYDNETDWLEDRIPMLGGLLTRHEREGADIEKKDAMYNGKPAFLYEIEMTLPGGDREAWRTNRFTWLVHSKTHLPIICENTRVYGHGYNGPEKGSLLRSRRYAFDYSDSGPADIYDLGVPSDANIVDERPSPQMRQLIDEIDRAKRTQYNSFAAVIVEDHLPRRLAIRDGRNVRDERFELNINYSDWEPKKEEYLRRMGQTFQSIYQWLDRTDIIRTSHLEILDEQFSYMTHGGYKKEYGPVEMNRRSGNNDQFSYYCWYGSPAGRIVTTPYSEKHNLICTLQGTRYHYWDPAKSYMSVRREDKEGNVRYELLDFAQTASGMWYPCKIKMGYYLQKGDSDELIPMSKVIHIYATDLNDELRAKLDPRSLSNFVDHRELTLQMKARRAEDANDQPCVEYTGFTPLHMAIYRQNIERVKKYIAEGADLEPAYDSGATPMELAVASGNLEMVKLLYQHGADFVSNDDEHRDALGLATKEGHHDIAEFLLAKGSDVNAAYKHPSKPLHYAAANGDVRMVELLLAHGAESDPRGDVGGTPLYHAVRRLALKLFYPEPTEQAVVQRFKDIIIMLIDKGADINARDTSQATPLSKYSTTIERDERNAEQQIEFLRFLLDCGADPNADVGRGINASFYRAAEAGRYDIIEVLLKGGADPWLVAPHMNRPARQNMLYYAHKKGDEKLYDLLYPYMKERFEQTNARISKIARSVFWAIMLDDPAAIAALCVDHPHESNTWKRWPKEIRKLYKEHPNLIDKMLPGWFTLDGLAEVYIPLPQGNENKSIVLGFIQLPNGQWKCIYYRQMHYMPTEDRIHASYFVNFPSHLDKFRNNLYDQLSRPGKFKTRGSGVTTLHGKFRGTMILTVQDDALRVDFHAENLRNRYALLTKVYVKKYLEDQLEVYTTEQIEEQKDYPQRLIFRPLKLIVENGETKHIFTVSDGQILLTKGQRRIKAPKFVFDLSTYKVVSPE